MGESFLFLYGFGLMKYDHCSYKYVPHLLKDILFPAIVKSPLPSSNNDTHPPRKRRRLHLDETEDVEMIDANVDVPLPAELPSVKLPTNGKGPLRMRPVILETAKESYQLSPNVLPASSNDGSGTGQRVVYEVAIIMEAEEVVEEDQAVEVETVARAEDKSLSDGDANQGRPGGDTGQDGSTEKTCDSSRLTQNDIASNQASVHPPSSSPLPPPSPSPTPAAVTPTPAPASLDDDEELAQSRALTPSGPDALSGTAVTADGNDTMVVGEDEIENPSANLGVVGISEGDGTFKPHFRSPQVLLQNLEEGMFKFEEDGVHVFDGVETWSIQVKCWRWRE